MGGFLPLFCSSRSSSISLKNPSKTGTKFVKKFVKKSIIYKARVVAFFIYIFFFYFLRFSREILRVKSKKRVDDGKINFYVEQGTMLISSSCISEWT